MDYSELVSRIEDQANLDTEGAEQALAATLTTLAERISEEEAEDLASQLPREVKAQLTGAGGDGEVFSVNEFVKRVADREGGIAPEEGRRHAEAVLITLREAMSGGEFEDILLQLPDDYLELFA
jgi:uncharacterized protein (DUF2267 family)